MALICATLWRDDVDKMKLNPLTFLDASNFGIFFPPAMNWNFFLHVMGFYKALLSISGYLNQYSLGGIW